MCQDEPPSPGICSGSQKARDGGSKLSSGGIMRLLRQKSNAGQASLLDSHGPRALDNLYDAVNVANNGDKQRGGNATQHRRRKPSCILWRSR